MNDPLPRRDNRLAYLTGQIFHPAIICVPTVALILSDLPLGEALAWTVLVVALVTLPGLVTMALLRRQGRYAYQRGTRQPLYIVIWLSVLMCLLVLVLLDGPYVMRVCLATLAVWLPVQMTINVYWTKVSTHVAVATGCVTGLWLLGHLPSLPLQVTGLAIIGLTAWARITTRNHTPGQVLLGLVVGGGTVLLVFPLLLS